MDKLDRARLIGYAVNDGKLIEHRQRELEARLRYDPDQPAKRQWTNEEMLGAAQRVVTAVLTTGKLPPKRPVS